MQKVEKATRPAKASSAKPDRVSLQLRSSGIDTKRLRSRKPMQNAMNDFMLA